jgi:hypothetical protein
MGGTCTSCKTFSTDSTLSFSNLKALLFHPYVTYRTWTANIPLHSVKCTHLSHGVNRKESTTIWHSPTGCFSQYCYVLGVSIDGVWIGDWICCTLTDSNYKYDNYNALTNSHTRLLTTTHTKSSQFVFTSHLLIRELFQYIPVHLMEKVQRNIWLRINLHYMVCNGNNTTINTSYNVSGSKHDNHLCSQTKTK